MQGDGSGIGDGSQTSSGGSEQVERVLRKAGDKTWGLRTGGEGEGNGGLGGGRRPGGQ